MEHEELLARVKQVIVQETSVPEERIKLDTALMDLGMDSLDILKLAAAFEKLFKVKITTAELLDTKTVGDIVDGLERKVVNPPA